jgi:hypothetical protein
VVRVRVRARVRLRARIRLRLRDSIATTTEPAETPANVVMRSYLS